MVLADEVKAVLAKAKAGEGALVAIAEGVSLSRAREQLARRLRSRGMDVEIRHVTGRHGLLVVDRGRVVAVLLPEISAIDTVGSLSSVIVAEMATVGSQRPGRGGVALVA